MRRRLSLVLVVLACTIGCSTLPSYPPSDPGREAAEQAVRTYVAALNASDPARLAVATGRDAIDAVKRIEVLGGREWQDVRVSLSSEFQGVYSVVIEATDEAGDKVSWRETIEWDGTQWDFAPFSPPAVSGMLVDHVTYADAD